MKIATVSDIDLTKYKLAFFEGDSCSNNELCQDDVMRMVDGGVIPDVDNIRIALIPKEKWLSQCSGDDWDDAPASGNASGISEFPKGTIFLEGKLGGELKLVEKFH